MSKGNSPAFPCVDKDKRMWTGMNLRDYFALEAMNSILRTGNYEILEDEEGWKDSDLINYKDVAERSYSVADAMLDEREKYR